MLKSSLGRTEAELKPYLWFHCTTVLLFNPLVHVVSMSRGGGFGMGYGSMVNVLTLSTAVPFACLTCRRLTLSHALHGWEVALQINHCLAKSAWQKKTPCHRNGGKLFLGGCF